MSLDCFFLLLVTARRRVLPPLTFSLFSATVPSPPPPLSGKKAPHTCLYLSPFVFVLLPSCAAQRTTFYIIKKTHKLLHRPSLAAPSKPFPPPLPLNHPCLSLQPSHQKKLERKNRSDYGRSDSHVAEGRVVKPKSGALCFSPPPLPPPISDELSIVFLHVPSEATPPSTAGVVRLWRRMRRGCPRCKGCSCNGFGGRPLRRRGAVRREEQETPGGRRGLRGDCAQRNTTLWVLQNYRASEPPDHTAATSKQGGKAGRGAGVPTHTHTAATCVSTPST